MKSQPNRNYSSNDVVMTPAPLAKAVMDHFKHDFGPHDLFLEPCRGTGAFFDLMPKNRRFWCELSHGVDFLAHEDGFFVVDDLGGTFSVPKPKPGGRRWIVTNPPWSQFRAFLERALSIADEIVFVCTVNHWWTKSRVRMVRDAGFGMDAILLLDTPPEFPQSGFQLGAVRISRGYDAPCAIERPAIACPTCKSRGFKPCLCGKRCAFCQGIDPEFPAGEPVPCECASA